MQFNLMMMMIAFQLTLMFRNGWKLVQFWNDICCEDPPSTACAETASSHQSCQGPQGEQERFMRLSPCLCLSFCRKGAPILGRLLSLYMK